MIDRTGMERPDQSRTSGVTRRRILVGGASLAAAASIGATEAAATPEPVTPMAGTPEVQPDRPFDPDSEAFSTAFVEYHDTLDTESDGDLWPSCWADDGHLYAANGDGAGFGDGPFADIAMNRIQGTPESGLTGERLAAEDEIASIWADPNEYNRKPTGMVAVDGNGDGADELYVAVQDLKKGPGAFDDAPNASVSVSTDYGRTWRKTDEPMFTDHRFTTIFFLDYGQSQEHARVLGAGGDAYVYAYGMDYNWRDSFTDSVTDPTRLYLARVPKASIQDRDTWEFFAGTNSAGAPDWNPDMERREPVLHDERRVYPTLQGEGIRDMTVISQGSVVYNVPLDRYIYTSWTEYTFEFYEAPQPWGPWKLFMRKDFGGYPWYGQPADEGCSGPKNGGYATTIPSKFISADGTTMWVQSNWFVGVECGPPNYNFSLRKLDVEPFVPSEASNEPDPANNLAVTGEGVTPIEKCARFGNVASYNDGVRKQSEDSFDRENKALDFWGYTWKRQYRLDRVDYTTGDMLPGGGWFRDGLKVQVRQDFEWVDVSGLSVSPDYPYDDTAGPNKTYTLTFDATRGDGVRIVGRPGGSAFFTSIGELEVYFDDR